MEPKTYVNYSEAFKRQVVSEIENGKFTSARRAGRAYGINGATTVLRWLRQHGRPDLMPKRVTISTMPERDETKTLKQRVRQLEAALADAHMKGLLDSAYLKIACEDLGIDLDEFKKKHVTAPFPKPPTQQPR